MHRVSLCCVQRDRCIQCSVLKYSCIVACSFTMYTNWKHRQNIWSWLWDLCWTRLYLWDVQMLEKCMWGYMLLYLHVKLCESVWEWSSWSVFKKTYHHHQQQLTTSQKECTGWPFRPKSLTITNTSPLVFCWERERCECVVYSIDRESRIRDLLVRPSLKGMGEGEIWLQWGLVRTEWYW